MSNIIIEPVHDEETNCWGLSVRHENGGEFMNTGFIFGQESHAIRKLTKVLSGLTDETITDW